MNKFIPFILLFIFSCGEIKKKSPVGFNDTLKNGHWLFSFDIGEELLPINAFYSKKDKNEIMVIKNGDEIIKTDDIIWKNDSVFISFPVFGTYFSGLKTSDSSLVGYFKNPSKSNDYKIPIEGIYGIEKRFSNISSSAPRDFSGRWDVTFSAESDDPCKAIGIFKQEGNYITGTFLTETGDYRFLEGAVSGNKMMLSTFDGAHVFLFKADLNADNELNGQFWSGNHWTESWTATRNEQIELSHPDSITNVLSQNFIQELTFTDLNDQSFSINKEKYAGKVLILQIMGSWCPNCADETLDFSNLYNRYQSEGLEIVAIAYESTDDNSLAYERINHFKNSIGAKYTFLYGGKANKKENSNDFKMIDQISSYPTAIFIDKKGKIRKVHSGYYGPGTGKYHLKYQEETEMFVKKLLSEQVNS